MWILKLSGKRGAQLCAWLDAVSLTLHDAAYLELAMRRGLPLATLDRDLGAAASAEKVEPLGI